jgi:hypothetical protein
MSEGTPADRTTNQSILNRVQLQERLSDLEAQVATAQRDLFRQQSVVDSARAELEAFKAAHRADLGAEPRPEPAPRPAAEADTGPTIIPERDRQNRSDTNSSLKTVLLILLGVLGALLLLALLWMLGIFPRTAAAPSEPILQDGNIGILGGNSSGATNATPEANALEPDVAGRFQSVYDRYGVTILGRPLSGPVNENGIETQWFERARLEYHPNLAGTLYEVQFSRLGAIYTDGRTFAEQQFFVSRPDLRFFDVTRHGVGGVFLEFWERNGGMETFGFPISEEFDEVLPDGNTYRVQYFERARLEYHPNLAGTEHTVQVGLLGTALYSNDPRRPMTMQPMPTPVPLP